MRAARRALRAGGLSGRPEADRVARIIADQALKHQVRPGVAALFGTFLGVMNLFNASTRYQSHGGWHWMTVTVLVLGALMLVGTAVFVPLAARSMRRTRAFVEAYDTRRRGRPPEGPERPWRRSRKGNVIISDW